MLIYLHSQHVRRLKPRQKVFIRTTVKIALSIWEQNTGLRKINMTFEEGGGLFRGGTLLT